MSQTNRPDWINNQIQGSRVISKMVRTNKQNLRGKKISPSRPAQRIRQELISKLVQVRRQDQTSKLIQYSRQSLRNRPRHNNQTKQNKHSQINRLLQRLNQKIPQLPHHKKLSRLKRQLSLRMARTLRRMMLHYTYTPTVNFLRTL